jgi:hypothetical protein
MSSLPVNHICDVSKRPVYRQFPTTNLLDTAREGRKKTTYFHINTPVLTLSIGSFMSRKESAQDFVSFTPPLEQLRQSFWGRLPWRQPMLLRHVGRDLSSCYRKPLSALTAPSRQRRLQLPFGRL